MPYCQVFFCKRFMSLIPRCTNYSAIYQGELFQDIQSSYSLPYSVVHFTFPPRTNIQPASWGTNEICRSVAYCMQPKTQTSAGQAALFAVSQASKCYIECGERDMFMWCQAIYSIIKSRGFDIAFVVSQEELKLWDNTQRKIDELYGVIDERSR